MALTLQIIMLVMSTLAFVGTTWRLLHHPNREPRIAFLSGVIASIGFHTARTAMQTPGFWEVPENPIFLRIAFFLGTTLSLILVAIAYREFRRRSRFPFLLGILAALPGIVLVLVLLMLEEGILWPTETLVFQHLYDVSLAAAGFLVPPTFFELLHRTDLWQALPPEPRQGQE